MAKKERRGDRFRLLIFHLPFGLNCRGLLVVADAGVKISDHYVQNEACDQGQDADEDQDSHYHRHILPVQGIPHGGAHPWPAHGALDDDDSREQIGQGDHEPA